MHHAGFGGVVMVTAELIVVQALSCTIGCGRHRAAPSGSADHLGREVVDRYLIGSGTLTAVLSLAEVA